MPQTLREYLSDRAPIPESAYKDMRLFIAEKRNQDLEDTVGVVMDHLNRNNLWLMSRWRLQRGLGFVRHAMMQSPGNVFASEGESIEDILADEENGVKLTGIPVFVSAQNIWTVVAPGITAAMALSYWKADYEATLLEDAEDDLETQRLLDSPM